MDLKFYEMHFEPTDKMSMESTTEYKSHFPLLRMTQHDAQTFCAIKDKVYHFRWKGDEFVRRLCYNPKTSYNVIVSLSTTYSEDHTIMALVYLQGVEWVLSVFQLNLKTLEKSRISEDTLHSKPNLLYLCQDVSSSNVVVFATFYKEPRVEIFSYSLEGCLTKVENEIMKHDYPCLFRCRGSFEKRNSLVDLHRVQEHYILCMDILLSRTLRYMVYGTVDGNVHLQVYDSVERNSWNAVYDWEGPISSVRLFKFRGVICLVVGCMVEQVILFTDITPDNKLSNMVELPDSKIYDSITCLRVMDIDYDGDVEILVGTYGCILLAYKLDFADSIIRPYVVFHRQYNSPVYGIAYSDITDDGLFEIIVLTFSGLHILQRCLKSAKYYIDSLLYEKNDVFDEAICQPVVKPALKP